MGCVRVSGGPDSRRRLPETTHETFFANSELRASNTQNLAKSLLDISFHAREPQYHGYVTDEKTAFTERLLVSRRTVSTVQLTYPKKVRTGEKSRSREG